MINNLLNKIWRKFEKKLVKSEKSIKINKEVGLVSALNMNNSSYLYATSEVDGSSMSFNVNSKSQI